jgi:copper chaperone
VTTSITHVFTVTGMHCASCAILIDETVEEEIAGVHRSQTDLRRGRTTVDTDADVDPALIIAAIGGAGYQAVLERPS